MLIAVVDCESSVDQCSKFYAEALRLLDNPIFKKSAYVDIAKVRGTIYAMGLDDGLSTAIVLALYRRARSLDLNASLVYGVHVEEDAIPSSVREAARMLSEGREVSKEAAESLKSVMTTGHAVAHICKK